VILESQLEIASEDGLTFNCYVAAPVAMGPVPAIVLVQEIFGINANVRWTANRFAEAGFLVAAPDLFWRASPGIELDPADPQQRARAIELNASFNSQNGLSDCRQTVDQLRRHASCNGRVGALGYCLGGRLAFLLAMQADVDAGVSFYPVAVQPELTASVVSNVPLLVHLGSDDALCKADAQLKIKQFVEEKTDNKVIIYDGVGHGFARLGRSGDAATAAERAESTTIAFLKKHLSQH
jgi:carboxymethylenebutenolidase